MKERIGMVICEDNYGVGVSTVLRTDLVYETALTDRVGVHPVERYQDEASASAGHDRWVVFSRVLETVSELGKGDERREIELVRAPFGVEN